MNIRLMERPQEIQVAVAFADTVYRMCVASQSTPQEQNAFHAMNRFDFLMPAIAEKEILMWGCFDGNNLVGVLALKNPGHIIMEYVWPSLQHRHIGSALLYEATNFCAKEIGINQLTVNAMPLPTMRFFERNGFYRRVFMQMWGNIRYIPMVRTMPNMLVKNNKGVGMGWVALGMLGISFVLFILVLLMGI